MLNILNQKTFQQPQLFVSASAPGEKYLIIEASLGA